MVDGAEGGVTFGGCGIVVAVIMGVVVIMRVAVVMIVGRCRNGDGCGAMRSEGTLTERPPGWPLSTRTELAAALVKNSQ